MKLLVISLCCLVVTAYSSPRHLSPSMDLEDELYNMSPEDAEDFFRFALLSKYGPQAFSNQAEDPAGLESAEYPASDQVLNYDDEPMSFDGRLDDSEFDNSLLPFAVDHETQGTTELKIPADSFENVDGKMKKEPPTTMATPGTAQDASSTISPSSTTPEPDALVSMPPVLPNNQGQKEFVMLRPPTDNQRKIDHWMENMAIDLGLQPHPPDPPSEKRKHIM